MTCKQHALNHPSINYNYNPKHALVNQCLVKCLMLLSCGFTLHTKPPSLVTNPRFNWHPNTWWGGIGRAPKNHTPNIPKIPEPQWVTFGCLEIDIHWLGPLDSFLAETGETVGWNGPFFCKEISMFNIVVLLFTGEQFLSPEDLLETGVFLGDGVRRQAEGGLLCRYSAKWVFPKIGVPPNHPF